MVKNRNSYLQHWGIPGMKWGQRKRTSSDSSSDSSSTSADHTRVVELKKKKLHELSNAEIRDVVTRMQLEQQYADLSKKKASAGEKFVKEILVNSGKEALSNQTKAYANSLLKGAIEAATGKKVP